MVILKSGGREMGRLNSLVDEAPSLPVTWTVGQYVPAALGVPLMTPPGDKVSPVGNEPDASDHVYGMLPPLAARVVE
jgi:hypothetical protein